ARRDQLAKGSPPHVETADGVQNDPDLDTRSRPLRKSADETAGDLALLENVSFQTNVALRRGNGFQLRLVESLPVREDVDAGFGVGFRIRENSNDARELGVVHRAAHRLRNAILQRGLGQRQKDQQKFKEHSGDGGDEEKGLHASFPCTVTRSTAAPKV